MEWNSVISIWERVLLHFRILGGNLVHFGSDLVFPDGAMSCRVCGRPPKAEKHIFCKACFSLLPKIWRDRISKATRWGFRTANDIDSAEMAAAIIESERQLRERLKEKA